MGVYFLPCRGLTMENQFFSDTFEGIQDYVMGGEVTAAEAVTLLTDLADKCRTLTVRIVCAIVWPEKETPSFSLVCQFGRGLLGLTRHLV